MNSTRTPTFTNGFAVTTGIDIKWIKYPKIIIDFSHSQYIGWYKYVLPLYIVKVVTHLRHVPLKTMHSTGHFRLLVIAGEGAAVP